MTMLLACVVLVCVGNFVGVSAFVLLPAVILIALRKTRDSSEAPMNLGRAALLTSALFSATWGPAVLQPRVGLVWMGVGAIAIFITSTLEILTALGRARVVWYVVPLLQLAKGLALAAIGVMVRWPRSTPWWVSTLLRNTDWALLSAINILCAIAVFATRSSFGYGRGQSPLVSRVLIVIVGVALLGSMGGEIGQLEGARLVGPFPGAR